jgi:hypothetical protein
MALNAVWSGQEYTIPNRRQLNYAVLLAWNCACELPQRMAASDEFVLFEFHVKPGRDESTEMVCEHRQQCLCCQIGACGSALRALASSHDLLYTH